MAFKEQSTAISTFSVGARVAAEKRFPHGTVDWFETQDFSIDYDSVKLLELVAKGSYGTVYKSIWSNTLVAAKLEDFHEGDEDQVNLLVELTMLQSFPHERLVKFLGAGCLSKSNAIHTERKLLIVMEYCERGALRECLRETIPWNLKTRIALDIATGLAFLHDNLIIHRDIKSTNVLIDKEWRAKLCDFSFACHNESTSKVEVTYGTDEFMSPEMACALDFDMSADIFSYGIVLCELITDREPSANFLCRRPQDLFAVNEKEVKSAVLNECPVALEALTLLCCDIEPVKRPTAYTCIDELTEVLNSLGGPEFDFNPPTPVEMNAPSPFREGKVRTSMGGCNLGNAVGGAGIGAGGIGYNSNNNGMYDLNVTGEHLLLPQPYALMGQYHHLNSTNSNNSNNNNTGRFSPNKYSISQPQQQQQQQQRFFNTETDNNSNNIFMSEQMIEMERQILELKAENLKLQNMMHAVLNNSNTNHNHHNIKSKVSSPTTATVTMSGSVNVSTAVPHNHHHNSSKNHSNSPTTHSHHNPQSHSMMEGVVDIHATHINPFHTTATPLSFISSTGMEEENSSSSSSSNSIYAHLVQLEQKVERIATNNNNTNSDRNNNANDINTRHSRSLDSDFIDSGKSNDNNVIGDENNVVDDAVLRKELKQVQKLKIQIDRIAILLERKLNITTSNTVDSIKNNNIETNGLSRKRQSSFSSTAAAGLMSINVEPSNITGNSSNGRSNSNPRDSLPPTAKNTTSIANTTVTNNHSTFVSSSSGSSKGISSTSSSSSSLLFNEPSTTRPQLSNMNNITGRRNSNNSRVSTGGMRKSFSRYSVGGGGVVSTVGIAISPTTPPAPIVMGSSSSTTVVAFGRSSTSGDDIANSYTNNNDHNNSSSNSNINNGGVSNVGLKLKSKKKCSPSGTAAKTSGSSNSGSSSGSKSRRNSSSGGGSNNNNSSSQNSNKLNDQTTILVSSSLSSSSSSTTILETSTTTTSTTTAIDLNKALNQFLSAVQHASSTISQDQTQQIMDSIQKSFKNNTDNNNNNDHSNNNRSSTSRGSYMSEHLYEEYSSFATLQQQAKPPLHNHHNNNSKNLNNNSRLSESSELSVEYSTPPRMSGTSVNGAYRHSSTVSGAGGGAGMRDSIGSYMSTGTSGTNYTTTDGRTPLSAMDTWRVVDSDNNNDIHNNSGNIDIHNDHDNDDDRSISNLNSHNNSNHNNPIYSNLDSELIHLIPVPFIGTTVVKNLLLPSSPSSAANVTLISPIGELSNNHCNSNHSNSNSNNSICTPNSSNNNNHHPYHHNSGVHSLTNSNRSKGNNNNNATNNIDYYSLNDDIIDATLQGTTVAPSAAVIFSQQEDTSNGSSSLLDLLDEALDNHNNNSSSSNCHSNSATITDNTDSSNDDHYHIKNSVNNTTTSTSTGNNNSNNNVVKVRKSLRNSREEPNSRHRQHSNNNNNNNSSSSSSSGSDTKEDS